MRANLLLPGLLALAGAAAIAVTTLPAPADTLKTDADVQQIFQEMLPNVPGNALSAVVVKYPPGGKSETHRHAGSVFAYVLSGAIRSENSATGPERVYQAGEFFFEPAGSTHLVSANASDSEPASLLAVFVAEENATLTVPAK